MFIHFTDEQSALAIVESKRLDSSSFVHGVYAASIWTLHVPGVQLTKLGRAKNRKWAVIFDTDISPTGWWPEEVVWDLPFLPLTWAKIVPAKEAIKKMVHIDHPKGEAFADAFEKVARKGDASSREVYHALWRQYME